MNNWILLLWRRRKHVNEVHCMGGIASIPFWAPAPWVTVEMITQSSVNKWKDTSMKETSMKKRRKSEMWQSVMGCPFGFFFLNPNMFLTFLVSHNPSSFWANLSFLWQRAQTRQWLVIHPWKSLEVVNSPGIVDDYCTSRGVVITLQINRLKSVAWKLGGISIHHLF